MIAYISVIMKGITVTLGAWLLTSCASLLIGTLLGIISCRYLGSAKLIGVIRAYTFVAKGIPAYVQILIAYFILPALLGVNIPAFAAACGALAFCSSGYTTEIMRAGINAIPRGQWDACATLGYPLSAQLKRIILPQAFKTIAPALGGELEQLLKSTSLLATIGITELTRTGMNIISRELNPVPVYLTIAGLYLIFSAMLGAVLMYSERRFLYGQR